MLQVTTFADRPGYERTSSSLWKQREEYCASLIQKAWKVHKVRNKQQIVLTGFVHHIIPCFRVRPSLYCKFQVRATGEPSMATGTGQSRGEEPVTSDDDAAELNSRHQS